MVVLYMNSGCRATPQTSDVRPILRTRSIFILGRSPTVIDTPFVMPFTSKYRNNIGPSHRGASSRASPSTIPISKRPRYGTCGRIPSRTTRGHEESTRGMACDFTFTASIEVRRDLVEDEVVQDDERREGTHLTSTRRAATSTPQRGDLVQQASMGGPSSIMSDDLPPVLSQRTNPYRSQRRVANHKSSGMEQL